MLPAEVTTAAHLQNMARNSNRIHALYLLNLGVLRSTSCAKYAAAFLRCHAPSAGVQFRLVGSLSPLAPAWPYGQHHRQPQASERLLYLPHPTAQAGLRYAQRLAHLHLRLPALHQAHRLQLKFPRVCRTHLPCHHFLALCLHFEQR